MQVAEILSGLRAAMKSEGVDALIVANTDPHNNEHVAERWRCRQWLTKMKGSSGTAVVTENWCGLWTDSRYYEAATIALAGSEIELMRASDEDVLSVELWLKAKLSNGATVAFNGENTDVDQATKWIERLKPAGYEIRTELDLIDGLWSDRPEAPKGELFLVDDEISGQRIVEKIAAVRAEMSSRKVDAHLLGRTDESCWLLNFRGTDIAGNPTPYCYTLVTMDEVLFFIDPDKVSAEGRRRFEIAGVTLKNYEEIGAVLEELSETTRILMVPRYTNYNLSRSAGHCVKIKDRALVTDLKGLKNATEVKHLKRILIEDGAAMVRFYVWLYRTLREGGTMTELQASRKLEACRAEIEGFRHVSFESIMGYAADGALNHYSVDEESDKPVFLENLFLIDSGGNFLHGTTDTTRVIPMGEANEIQKEDYTLVLRALLEVIMLEFPEGTTGAQLDGICRQALWKHGRNFKHGTGHGVGFGLEVHEGPQNISAVSVEKMKVGQITTIEPGCYRADQWGIRIENMVHTVLSRETEFGPFYKFENLTFCPINVDLVLPSLLSADQLAWLNDYNAEVVEKLTPSLNDEERAWLAHECRPVA